MLAIPIYQFGAESGLVATNGVRGQCLNEIAANPRFFEKKAVFLVFLMDIATVLN